MWDLTAKDPNVGSIILYGHEGGIKSLNITLDNRWLVSHSSDGTVRLWNLCINELIDLACRTASRNLTKTEWDQYFPGQPYRKTFPSLPLGRDVELDSNK